MTIKSINPFNGQVVGEYAVLTAEDLDKKLSLATEVFSNWKNLALEYRCEMLFSAAEVLRNGVEEYAQMISLEMGKPIKEARTEVVKCAWVCTYYAENAPAFLASVEIKTDATKSYLRHDPIGAVLAIMPWNFPFWQVFRFAAPTLVAGNVGLLKACI